MNTSTNEALCKIVEIKLKRNKNDKKRYHLLRRRMRRNALKNKQLCAMLTAFEVKRGMWKLDRCSKFWEHEVANYNDSLFKQHFRLTRDSFAKLVSKMQVLKREDSCMRRSICVDKRVAIALYALSSSSEYRTVATLFGVGRTTVGELVLEFCDAVYSELKTDYFNAYPATQRKVEEIVNGFKTIGFPQCYGAIGLFKYECKYVSMRLLPDGTHIEVCPPKEEATDYYNFKGWYSIILFAAVDYKYRFTYINVGATGRNNDSYIYENSLLKLIHERSEIFKENCIIMDNVQIPVMLLGDSAFKLSSFVMKPYPQELGMNEEQRNFNYKLSKCRRVVENAFGHLKARFRKIGRGMETNVENAHRIIQACCLLHNFLIEERDEVFDNWLQEHEIHTAGRAQPAFVTNRDHSAQGIQIRNILARNLARDVDAPADEDAGDAGFASNSPDNNEPSEDSFRDEFEESGFPSSES